MTIETAVTLTGRADAPNRLEDQLWLGHRLHPDAPFGNMPLLSWFDERVDTERFIAAVDGALTLHEAMRTIYPSTRAAVGTAPRPVVLDSPPRRTELVALSLDEFDAWISARVVVPIAIDAAVYDSVLIDCDGRHGWLMNLHHVASDAASAAIVFDTAASLYSGKAVPGSSYRDYVESAGQLSTSKAWQRASTYWAAVEAEPTMADLYQPAKQTSWSATRTVVDLGSDINAKLAQLLESDFKALTPQLSEAAVLACAIAVFRHRLLGATSTMIGFPVHNRNAASQNIVGCCMDVFPLVVTVEHDESFRTLHSRTLKQILRLLAHAQPNSSDHDDFDVILNVLPTTMGSFGEIATRTVSIFPEAIEPSFAMRVQSFDWSGTGETDIVLDINDAVASPDQQERADQHFAAVINAMVGDPDSTVGGFELITPEEHAVLETYNDRAAAKPVTTVVDDLHATLAGHDRIALVDGETELRGSEVLSQSVQIADWLFSMGVRRGGRVGIRMAPSSDAVLAIYGVLLSGAAFVPLDPEYPAARLDHICANADIDVVLDELPAASELSAAAPQPNRRRPDLGDLAYVLYTSGSTGLPKGVPITHRGLKEYLDFAIDAYLTSDTVPTVPLFSSLSFDLTITSLFLPVLAGGTIRCHRSGGLRALREIVDDDAVTLLKATPSHLELLVRMITPDHPLQTLVVGGEMFTRSLAERLREALGPDVRIFNEYGPTEAVVGCMIHEYDPRRDIDPQVPIGRPAPGVGLFVLDQYGRRMPLGVEGELHLQRPGMTAGYHQRPQLNQELFVKREWLCPETLYASGDRVRIDLVSKDDSSNPVGHKMIYLGRIDEQLKVQGVRLEPGEVESALCEHPAISRAAVRPWRAKDAALPSRHCQRCGVPTNVPGVSLGPDEVCELCTRFDDIAAQTNEYFRNHEDLLREIRRAQARGTGDHDILHLLSGGKDSTYALYQLVAAGARVRTMTLDNGFISEHALDNARRATEHLGVLHEVVTTPAMNEIFRDSLERFSNVCNGCYKAIYTLAINRADEHGVPLISTGLSRGQLFETRLVPAQFTAGNFDPDAIDATVLSARRAYHRTEDAVTRLLDTSVFDDDSIFERVEFLDFYRYTDVELQAMLDFLENETAWQRPTDTGRSTNCLINVAGISVHQAERGFHNYAVPYAWDVRLGHKTRDEAIAELDDEIDDNEVTGLLAEIGYEPRKSEVLTAWYVAEQAIDPQELRQHLEHRLPAHSVPAAFVAMQEIPLTPNGKVAVEKLPAPTQRGTHQSEDRRFPESAVEQTLADIWATVLELDGLGIDDDFFDLGGTSLRALEMIVWVSDHFETHVPEAAAFEHRTIHALATEVERIIIAEIDAMSDADVQSSLTS